MHADVNNLIRLLTIPVSSATTERSFSSEDIHQNNNDGFSFELHCGAS